MVLFLSSSDFSAANHIAIRNTSYTENIIGSVNRVTRIAITTVIPKSSKDRAGGREVCPLLIDYANFLPVV